MSKTQRGPEEAAKKTRTWPQGSLKRDPTKLLGLVRFGADAGTARIGALGTRPPVEND